MKSINPRPPRVLSGEEIRRAIRESVEKFLDLNEYQLFIFGSEATGVADRRSDIDVGILGSVPVPISAMASIRQELETVRTLRMFDVVDFSRVNEAFRNE